MKVYAVILAISVLRVIADLSWIIKEQRERKVDFIPFLHQDQLALPLLKVFKVTQVEPWN